MNNHIKLGYYFFKQSYFQFLIRYIVINAYIYFLNVKNIYFKVILINFHMFTV